MLGLMQNQPLLISTIIDHAAENHGDTEIITREIDRSTSRLTYADISSRSKKLANVLKSFGFDHGTRVGSLAWNSNRHLEFYYGVSGSGLISHTINPRLFFDQILYIVQHARDRAIFFDVSFVDIVEKLAPQCPFVEHWVAMCSPSELPSIPGINVLCYETLIASQPDDFVWPVFDENLASSLCYTSGSTGNPKGVLYSHRSTVLHSYALAMADTFAISASNVVLPASSMYHANAWGVPYTATLAGSKMVMPGRALDAQSLVELINQENVTISFGVPTIWLSVLQYLDQSGAKIDSLKYLVIGGSSCPPSLMKDFKARYGVEVLHIWGMTETSPIGTVNRLKPKQSSLSASEQDDILAKQGRTVYGVKLRLTDDEGREVPRDGKTPGNLYVKGWWIASRYYGSEPNSAAPGNWFHTGDVATIDPDGFLRLTDRTKDVIKSGGEWISSIDLENAAVGHPAVAEAAVIGVAHPKWDERPLLILKLKDGKTVSPDEMRNFLSDKVVKWWLPDDVVTIDEIPHTATGKILKTELRKQFQDHYQS